MSMNRHELVTLDGQAHGRRREPNMKHMLVLCSVLFTAALVGCKKDGAQGGVIAIDGSSTVFPISEAVAEDFQKAHAAKVSIGVSGTGGGFKKFCQGEIAIAGASRPIKS